MSGGMVSGAGVVSGAGTVASGAGAGVNNAGAGVDGAGAVANDAGMRLLFEIDARDYDPAGKRYVRNSGRCVALKGGKVAMVHSVKYDYYKFPGGGIEEGESGEEAMVREALEEAGLVVRRESVRPFGYVHRVQRALDPELGAEVFVQDNFYYLCEVEDEVQAQALDDYEAEEGFRLEWVWPEAAMAANLRQEHGPKDMNMIRREARVLGWLVGEGLV